MKGKKISGGIYHKSRKRKKSEIDNQPRIVKLGPLKTKQIRTMGGKIKTVLLAANQANILNQKTKKSEKAIIKNVIETPSNKFMARQNILVKSAVIDTDKGKARITNRPSQEGCVNAVLIVEEVKN